MYKLNEGAVHAVFSNEKEMVKRLIQYYGNQLVFEEIGVGYGISDLIIIRNRTDFLNFINVRSGLYLNSLDEIKVLNFLRLRKKSHI
ncbi:hypothetical protein HMSSN036_87130 [Paenibacillus macerans]|nr:hypothetical protein HMSSN036_87130 [Paenibacillus macerans]